MPESIFFHPTILMLIVVASLLLTLKYNKAFFTIAVASPILISLSLRHQEGLHLANFLSLKPLWQYNFISKLIGQAFLIVLTATNIYASRQNKKTEIIIGSACGAFALLTILSEDFISMFIGIETMMILSCILIFKGKDKGSARAARKYFLTHLISGSLILCGMAYLISINGTSQILLFTPLLTNFSYSSISYILIFIGLIINIAAFPFSGWMVNYYRCASPISFVYLITFSTKAGIVLLIKLFAGYNLLASIGSVMIIYTALKIIFEDKILGLLCYLSIMQTGIILIGISHGSETLISASIIYLFIHILYKALLSLLTVTLSNSVNITRISELTRINNLFFMLPLVIALGIMTNIPLPGSVFSNAKAIITNSALDNSLKYIITLSSIVPIIAIPIRNYLFATQNITINFNKSSIISIHFITYFLLASCFYPGFLSIITHGSIPDLSSLNTYTIKQLTLITLGLIIALFFKFPKKSTISFNLIERLGDIFAYYNFVLSNKARNNLNREPWSSSILIKETLNNLKAIHNQQTAIFIVFFILVTTLITFIIYLN